MNLWNAPETWLSRTAKAKADALEYANVRHIAVIKHGALGDLLLVRPMLVTLKNAFPDAQLTLSVVSNYMKGLPEDLVDRVHVAKGNEREYPLGQIIQSYRQLGDQDILFDISATTRSFWITKFNKATLKIGFQHRSIHRFLYDVAIPRAHYRFEAETFLEQVNVIGLSYDWPLDFAPKKLPSPFEKPYIVYFPTASVRYKCWPASSFAELIQRSCEKFPEFQHILLGGVADWEKKVANEISASVGTPDNFLTRDGDESMPALISNASVLVSNDTGIRNLAITAGTATVGIFPRLFTVFGYRPYFGNHEIVYSLTEDMPQVTPVFEKLELVASRLRGF
jgi:ADP-heptose:LPS heptosyltransferase